MAAAAIAASFCIAPKTDSPTHSSKLTRPGLTSPASPHAPTTSRSSPKASQTMPGLVAAMTEKIQGALKKGEADKPAAEVSDVIAGGMHRLGLFRPGRPPRAARMVSGAQMGAIEGGFSVPGGRRGGRRRSGSSATAGAALLPLPHLNAPPALLTVHAADQECLRLQEGQQRRPQGDEAAGEARSAQPCGRAAAPSPPIAILSGYPAPPPAHRLPTRAPGPHGAPPAKTAPPTPR